MIWKLAATALGLSILFAIWHGPGLARSMRSNPPSTHSGAERVRVEQIELERSPGKGEADWTYPARVFVLDEAASKQTLRPLVVYMPSWGAKADDNDFLLRRIAAEGYLVVAVDDVEYDKPEPGESDDVTKARSADLDLTSPAGIEEFVAAADRKAVLAGKKLSQVIDAVIAGNHNVDRCRIGAIGFSFGGTAATLALSTDPRVRAGINLDGWIFGVGSGQTTAKPYLAINSSARAPPFLFHFVTSRRNSMSVDELSYRRKQPLLAAAHSLEVTLPGTVHADFSDFLHTGQRWKSWRPWNAPLTNPLRVRDWIDELVLGFLNKHVKQINTACIQ